MVINLKTVLITGGTRGIGKAMVEKFAKEGYSVAFNYTSSESAAKKLEEEIINTYGVEVLPIKCDVSNFEDTKNMVKTIKEKYGKIDVLVNNAGITKDKLIARMNEEDFDSVIAVNLKGVYNCTKHVSRLMCKAKSGKIVNISSVSGIMGNPGQLNYSAAKAGVIGMTKTLAKELARYNINVNAVAPGFIATDMTEKMPQDAKDMMTDAILLKRMGETSDIANMVYFLADETGNYITGQIISVDGGLSI